jgi:hypothetical protein
MLSTANQEVVDRIIAERIALYTEIIRTGNEDSQMAAAMQLGSIGTKYSDQAALELIGQPVDDDICDILIGALALNSPNREALKPKIMKLFEDNDEFDPEFESLTQIDPRLLEAPPLWQEIAEALGDRYANKLRFIRMARRIQQTHPFLEP